MDWVKFKTKLYTNITRRSVPVHGNVSRTWIEQPNNYSKRDTHRKRNRHYKYLLAVILSGLFPSPALAQTVGGVSATASPVANSSGSVTNQAVQVLQGPYITNTYGGGVQCQGPTMNFTPFVTGSLSAARPYEPYYDDPVYDVTDNFGDFDDDGKPIGDGILDNPGDVIFYKNTRTGQKDNYNLSVGFSATWSRPMDRKLQEQCKEAANTQIQLQQQLTANKRLDFEIARLKNCGELLKQGISFHPKSRYYSICADVVVQNVTTVSPHIHSIPSVSSSVSGTQTSMPSLHDSSDAALLGGPLQTRLEVSSPE